MKSPGQLAYEAHVALRPEYRPDSRASGLTTAKGMREFYGPLGASASMRVLLVDRQIDALRADLERREPIGDETRSEDWTRAFSRHPYFRTREHRLYASRYIATQERDHAIYRAKISRERAEQHAYRKQSSEERKAAALLAMG